MSYEREGPGQLAIREELGVVFDIRFDLGRVEDREYAGLTFHVEDHGQSVLVNIDNLVRPVEVQVNLGAVQVHWGFGPVRTYFFFLAP
jgi:hypothetical protein